MYTQDQINSMSQDQLKAALSSLQGMGSSTNDTSAATPTDLKTFIQQEIAAALDNQQPKAVSFTENFLEKHQVSPQVAAAIAVGAIGGVVEIIKALLPILFK